MAHRSSGRYARSQGVIRHTSVRTLDEVYAGVRPADPCLSCGCLTSDHALIRRGKRARVVKCLRCGACAGWSDGWRRSIPLADASSAEDPKESEET